MFTWDETKEGRVVAITGTTAHIRTARGGRFNCHNEGFKIGDTIQYITDTLCKNIIAVRNKPEDCSVDPLTEYLQTLEPVPDEEDFDEVDSNGQVDPWDSDWFGGNTGVDDTESTTWLHYEPEPIPLPLGTED